MGIQGGWVLVCLRKGGGGVGLRGVQAACTPIPSTAPPFPAIPIATSPSFPPASSHAPPALTPTPSASLVPCLVRVRVWDWGGRGLELWWWGCWCLGERTHLKGSRRCLVLNHQVHELYPLSLCRCAWLWVSGSVDLPKHISDLLAQYLTGVLGNIFQGYVEPLGDGPA